LRNALRALPIFCPFIMGAMRFADLVMAPHPAGAIAPAAAFTLLNALSTCDLSSLALFAQELLARPTCHLRFLRIISGTSLNAAASRRSQGDTKTFARALGRLAIAASILPTFCAFIVGAVRSTALAKAAHPAGDIAPAAASTLRKAFRALPISCVFVVGAVRSAALAQAAHPAGDIAPAAASTLPIQLKHFPQF